MQGQGIINASNHFERTILYNPFLYATTNMEDCQEFKSKQRQLQGRLSSGMSVSEYGENLDDGASSSDEELLLVSTLGSSVERAYLHQFVDLP